MSIDNQTRRDQFDADEMLDLNDPLDVSDPIERDDQLDVADGELPLLSMIIPAYNEELMLESSLTTIYEHLQGMSQRYRFEVIVIDDGSTDRTREIAESFAVDRPEVRVAALPSNMRLGEALRYGFKLSRGDVVIVFDSDLSYSVDHIDAMLHVMREEHAKIVVASPYMKGGETTAVPWRRAAMSREVNRLLSATSQSKVKTVTGMVRAYDGIFIRSLPLKSMGPEVNTEILYKAQIMRARVAEVPAHLDWSQQTERIATRKVSLRVSTTSKLLMFSSFLFRPILFFVIPGLLLMALATWSTVSVFLTVLDNARSAAGSLHFRLSRGFADAWEMRPQTFIIAGFSFTIAVQLIMLGVLAAQAKRYFEELFYAANRNRTRRRQD